MRDERRGAHGPPAGRRDEARARGAGVEEHACDEAMMKVMTRTTCSGEERDDDQR
jgi:hypothetical protein